MPIVGQRQRRDAARQRAGHAGLHEPRAGRGRPRAARAAVGRLQPRRHALLPADRQAAVRGGRRRRGAPQGPAGRVPTAAAARPVDRPGAGGGLPQGDGDSSPTDRYASCRALAEDVERWMADEPVSAWREPLSRRARRWARRNRTAVTGGGGGAGRRGRRAGGGRWSVQTRAKAEIARALSQRDRGQHGPWPPPTPTWPLEGRRAGAVRPGGGGDQDVPHRRQRGLPAQGGPVQGRCATGS